MTDEVHDHSRVDAFMAARRRAMVMRELWKPTLAGAAGATLIIAAVAVAQPKFVMLDVTVPKIVQRDVTVDHIVPRDLEIDIPRIVTAPSKDTPRDADETRFAAKPEYQEARPITDASSPRRAVGRSASRMEKTSSPPTWTRSLRNRCSIRSARSIRMRS